VWVKPIKSVSSALAYQVEDEQQLRQALATIREGIGRMGEPFDFVLSQLELPPEVNGVGGRACLAEEAATGAQVTVEGYSFEGDVHVYGTVDSITCADSSSFLRYQYPSSLPSAVTQRMAEISGRVIRQIGLDGITFNIEYFWDPDHDTISLLEVNPRHSQSHAELFEQVDGLANHDHMLQLALGREPRPRHREGPYDIAAKWFVRRTTDGVARRVPTSEEVERVEQDIPGCTVDVTVTVGDRLSELYDQDSYSYALATVYLGADDEDELIRKYEQALEGLPFEFEEPTG
jgi:biotin carboxylase